MTVVRTITIRDSIVGGRIYIVCAGIIATRLRAVLDARSCVYIIQAFAEFKTGNLPILVRVGLHVVNELRDEWPRRITSACRQTLVTEYSSEPAEGEVMERMG